jgi:hypothetical protein
MTRKASIKPPRRSVELSPEAEREVRIGIEQAERGEVVEMSQREFERFLEADELPERVKRWLDSYDSHGTFSPTSPR